MPAEKATSKKVADIIAESDRFLARTKTKGMPLPSEILAPA
jgi:hypothetical protein